MTEPALNFENIDQPSESANIDITKRGFTNHEHLDAFELIHMNGRMYDFNTGRFLSVDPFIQGVDSQAINPYSYIQNNPLAGIDPTGYNAEQLFHSMIATQHGQEFSDELKNAEVNGKIAVGSVVVSTILIIDEATDYINPIKGIVKHFGKRGIKASFSYLKNKFKKSLRNGKDKATSKVDYKGDVSTIGSNSEKRTVGGVEVKKNPSEQRAALEEAGHKGEKITNKSGSDKGTKHIVEDKKMEVRVMDGDRNNKPRVVTSSAKNPKQKVDSNTGKPFKNNVPKEVQIKNSHIELEKDKR